MRQSNCGWGTADHAKLAAPCPLLLALDRPSPGLIQELAAFSYEHACCLLQRQAHATSGRHDRKPSPPPRTIRLDYVSRRRRWRGGRGRRGCCLARTTKKTHQGTKTSQASTFTGAGGGGGIHGIPLQAGNAYRPPHEQKRKGRLRWRVPRLHRLLASLPCTTCSVYGV